MSHIDIQIFTREPISGKEQEPTAGWTEHPKRITGFYNKDVPLWKPKDGNEDEGVYFTYFTDPDGGIGIISRGQEEVFSGEEGLIIRDKPVTTAAVTTKNDRACARISKAEIFFHYGATMGLTIKVDGQPVKEVKIVGAFSE